MPPNGAAKYPVFTLRKSILNGASAAMGVVEAAHIGDGDDQAWCVRLLAAARGLLKSEIVNLAITRRRETHFELTHCVSTVPGVAEQSFRTVPTIEPTLLDHYVRYPRYVGSARGILVGREPPADLATFMADVGAQDVLGLVVLSDDVSMSIGCPQPELVELSRQNVDVLTQVMLHVEAGLRLRLNPGAELAVLRPDGRLLHATGAARGDAEARSRLSTHVADVERSRTRRVRQSLAGIDAWSALISGAWGLVERVDSDGARHYVVVDTARSRRLRALSPLQMQAVELSARGLTGKAVAYALGVAASSVSKALSEAAFKLGIKNRTELVALVARLLGVAPVAAPGIALTSAERDVLELVRLGWANAHIAQVRGRSAHTVANQVASLLRKLEVPSRRALATTAAPAHPSE